jgi:uncharacterized protein
MELTYTWGMFDRDIELIKKTASIDYLTWSKFKSIVAISKGGLVLGVKLANIFSLPLYIVNASSYDDNGKHKKLKIESFYPINREYPILLIDYISDSGKTLKEIKKHINIWSKEVTTLTLFYRKSSKFIPDHSFNIVDKEWVVFPWEK